MSGSNSSGWAFPPPWPAGRLIDRVDATELLRINAHSLDTRYLADWVVRLQLRDEFTQAGPLPCQESRCRGKR